jgi:hypothetical protein
MSRVIYLAVGFALVALISSAPILAAGYLGVVEAIPAAAIVATTSVAGFTVACCKRVS